ncbi:tetratricopeptide repeat protein [Kangiella marina]|uniref:Tetratricopeptide repeat protein n=1 Tax=Kangiella marina TaxID=1079178 RepID=A0ABP8ICY4_9GAMM
MLVWLALLLMVLVWAAWLFGQVFTGKGRIFTYISVLLIATISSLTLYYFQGAHQSLKDTAELHQRLDGLSLKELASKADQKEITVQELLSELRLRTESDPHNFEKWRELGNIFLRFGEVGRAEQAFNRAVAAKPGAETRIEFARNFMEQGSAEAFENAERHINLVLMEEPKHEGALLMQGINHFKQQEYQAAIDYWQELLQYREPGSESYQIISGQIDQAKRQLKLAELNHISVVVDNVDSLLLTRYKKAFVLVRQEEGGPPIAVKSVDVAQLHQPQKLTPANVMLPGTSLWTAENTYIEVRLSQSGLAQPEPGDRFGRTSLKKILTPSETVHVEITQTVE